MKATIRIDVPDRDKLVDGLDVYRVHPALARAEAAVTEAERSLQRAREDFTARDREVTELPARITAVRPPPTRSRKRSACATRRRC